MLIMRYLFILFFLLTLTAYGQTVSVRSVSINAARSNASTVGNLLRNTAASEDDTLTVHLKFNLRNFELLQMLRIRYGKESDSTSVLTREYTLIESGGRYFLLNNGVGYLIQSGNVEFYERLFYPALTNTVPVHLSGKDKMGKDVQVNR